MSGFFLNTHFASVLRPDFIVWLDLSPHVAMARVRKRGEKEGDYEVLGKA